MSNTASPAPAAAGEVSTAPSEGMSILDMIDDADVSSHALVPAATNGSEIETATADEDNGANPAEAATGTEIEPEGEGRDPAPDAEPEADEDGAEKPKAKIDLDDDDAVTHLRDRTPVTVKDLKATYERHRDLETRILPAIQREYQSQERELQQARASQQQIQPVLADVTTFLTRRMPPEPSADMLDPNSHSYDPLEYNRQVHLRQIAVAEVQQVTAARLQHEQAQAQFVKEQQGRYIAEQRQLLAQKVPQIRDANGLQEFSRRYHEAGSYVGFSPAEMSEAYDHRLILLADLAADGIRLRNEQTKKAQATTQQARQAAPKVAGVPPAPQRAPAPKAPAVAAPTARQAPTTRANASARQSLETLRKTGSTRAADDFFSRFE